MDFQEVTQQHYRPEILRSPDLVITHEMVRTEGRGQRCEWYPVDQPCPEGNWWPSRKYFRGIWPVGASAHYPEGAVVEVFGKHIVELDPSIPLSIPEFVRYQAENLVIARPLDTCPQLVAFDEDTILMTYVKAQTLKEWWYAGHLTDDFVEAFLPISLYKANLLNEALRKHGRAFDLSVNNTMLAATEETGERRGVFLFVDLDWVAHRTNLLLYASVLIQLGMKLLKYDSEGMLVEAKTGKPVFPPAREAEGAVQ